MISIYSRSPEPATVNHDVLSSFFSTEQGNNGATFLHRRRSSTRGFVRILFPKFVVKAKDAGGQVGRLRYQLKPDGLATFMFFVFLAVGIVALFDPNASDEYPAWMPLAAAGWYVLLAIIEIVRTKAAFDQATNGQPLPESDLVAQVTALLDAEQNDTDRL